MNTNPIARLILSRILPLMLAFAGAAYAQSPADPPARVASLSQIEGSVVFAPAGETEWVDAALNRPITRGDRLWTDRGARAEVHAGSAVLHMDGQTYLDVAELDDDVLQASLNEGSVNARVREIDSSDNFEIDTPQLAFRASRPGDYRLDVDPAQGTTRVTVRSGAALVYGANGQGQQLAAGQSVTFAGTDLERIAAPASPGQDGFDRWAADRNRAEDQSVAARYIPREVVGYQQLDPYGSWAQDTSYGAVWYPRVTVADWAPYRYGHWESISPWGWTWIDDAPWGFAPFHYGRWAMIGSRWAWVPGRMGPRPVYAPALVAFVGGGGGVNFSLSIGSGDGIGWFPLGPGEAWQPTYRASTLYLNNVNRYAGANRRQAGFYVHQQRPSSWTSVRMEDFSRGRPVNRHWQPMHQADVGRLQVLTQPALPQPRRFVEETRTAPARVLPPPQLAAPGFAVQPRTVFQGQGGRGQRDAGESPRPVAVPRPQEAPRPQQFQQPRRVEDQQPRRLEQQQRAIQEDQQRRLQVQQQERAQRERERMAREQREQGSIQRDHARQQQAAQAAQAAQAQAARQQLQVQEQAQRQQQAVQERALRQQQKAQEQAQRQAAQPPRVVREQPQGAAAPVQRERGGRGRDQRDDDRSPGGEDGARGRGQGRGG